jgi:hypothetical protein
MINNSSIFNPIKLSRSSWVGSGIPDQDPEVQKAMNPGSRNRNTGNMGYKNYEIMKPVGGGITL